MGQLFDKINTKKIFFFFNDLSTVVNVFTQSYHYYMNTLDKINLTLDWRS